IVRDYLVEPDDARAASQKAELLTIRTQIDNTVQGYDSTFPEDQQRALKDLGAQVDLYWQSLTPVLQWDASARRRLGEDYLLNVIVPSRAKIGELARRVNTLNERDLDAGETNLQELQASFRRRVTTISVVTLILGGVLAGVMIRRMQYLEHSAEARYL